jgi:DNA-binding SARP family transcriptional activator
VTLRYAILGPLEAAADGGPLAVGGPRVRALLAVLLLDANRVVPTTRLVDALWEEEPPASARQALHFLVHKLRRILAADPGGRGALATKGSGYVLEVEPGALDTDRFEQLVAEGRAAAGRADHEAASGRFGAALGLWRGEPLAEFAGAAFAQAAAARFGELRLAAVEERADAELALGRHAGLVAELEALVREHPLRERPRAQLILALYRSGRRAEALEAYRSAERVFLDELGIEPGPQLQRLGTAVTERAAWLDGPPAAPAPVRAPAPAAAPPEAPPAPPREERKLVTVLVTALHETGPGTVDPEDASTRLAAGLERVERGVRRFGGKLQAVVGGTAVVVFGVPVAYEDDPERAVRAAFDLAGGSEPDGLVLQAGVSLGEALITPGDGLPAPRAVTGAVVDRAAALAAAAGPGEVVVSPAVERATRRRIDYHPFGGTAGETSFAVTGPRSQVGAAEPPAVTSPLLEREHELAVLRSLLSQVRWGREPQLLTLVGDPGVGKSRLIYELGRVIEADPDLVWWRPGRSLPYGEGVTFWALGEIVKAHAGILDTDDAAATAAKLDKAVRDALDDPADVAWVLRHLQPLVSSAGGAAGDQVESFAAWRRFLEALAGERPTVLVLEDLHWADDALLDFVDDLVERIAAVPLLVVCATRPELFERRPGWGGGKRNATTLSLSPLSPAATATLLDGVAAGTGPDRIPLPEGTREAVVAAAGGNPLFVEEYVRVLRDRGLLDGSGPLPVPDTVQQLITARLDTMEADDKRLLQTAAVFGEVAWVGALAAVSGTQREQVERWLRRVERRELARRTRTSSVAGEVQFAFRHALVRDVAYGQLTRAQRVAVHRDAAGWLEGLGDGRAADRAELLAHHYLQALGLARATGADSGELAGRARLALREAGDRAARLSAWSGAAAMYATALELWPEDDPARADLLLGLGEAQFYGERAGEAALNQARDLLLEAGDRARAADAEMMLAFLAFWRGDLEARELHGQRAFGLVWDQPPSSAKAVVLSRVSGNQLLRDEVETAIAIGAEAVEVARALGDLELEAQCLSALGMARVRAGDRRGLEDMDRCMDMLEQRRSSNAAQFGIHRATSLSWMGELAAAGAAVERSAAAAERFGSRGAYLTYIQGVRAMYFFLVGRWPEALAAALTVLEVPEPHFLKSPCGLIQARLRLGAGDEAGADTAIDAAFGLARAAGDVAVLQPTGAFKARRLLEQNRAEEAAGLVPELVAGLGHGFVHVDSGPDLGVVLAGAGHGPELLDSLPIIDTPWLAALRAVLAGDLAGAAGCYDGIGAGGFAADCLVLDAEAKLAAGKPAAAVPGLTRAAAFYRDAGATAAEARARRLLARSGPVVAG